MLISAIRSSLPRRSERNVVYTLSGGWDSRLLAALASRRRRRLNTWTTKKHLPIDADASIARTVAEHLGSNHREITPTLSQQRLELVSALSRFHHATWLHSWLEPLASGIREQQHPIVDGLGGDILLKGLLQVPDDDQSGKELTARYALWQRLGGWSASKEHVWSGAARAMFNDIAFDDFDNAIAPCADSPNWQTLAILVTRTARGIALSPTRLFGPEVRVFLPFLSRDSVTAALSPEVHRVRGAALYRQLISSVDLDLGLMPSTNDVQVRSEMNTQTAAYHPETLKHIADTVTRRDPAISLLGPRLTGILMRADVNGLAEAMNQTGPSRAIFGAYAYASWLNDHPHVKDGLLP
ncbi:MAG TPA: asparagine synthase-related protein [Acidimicrobiia bacterium]